MSKKNRHLTIGVDEDIPFSQSAILGLQHVLAMDVYVPPFILATALALSPGDAAGLIQSTFLGAGLASLIQVGNRSWRKHRWSYFSYYSWIFWYL